MSSFLSLFLVIAVIFTVLDYSSASLTTTTACVSNLSDIPKGWVAYNTAETSSCPPIFGVNYTYVAMTNLNILAPAAMASACIRDFKDLPAGWLPTTTGLNGACNTAHGQSYAAVNIRNLNGVESGYKTNVCLSSVNDLPTGWVASGMTESGQNCNSVLGKSYIYATVQNLND